MRVLARREPVNRRDARLVVTPARAADNPRGAPPRRPRPVRRLRSPPRSGPLPAPPPAAPSVAAPVLLLSTLVVVTGLAAFAIVPWWSVAIPGRPHRCCAWCSAAPRCAAPAHPAGTPTSPTRSTREEPAQPAGRGRVPGRVRRSTARRGRRGAQRAGLRGGRPRGGHDRHPGRRARRGDGPDRGRRHAVGPAAGHAADVRHQAEGQAHRAHHRPRRARHLDLRPHRPGRRCRRRPRQAPTTPRQRHRHGRGRRRAAARRRAPDSAAPVGGWYLFSSRRSAGTIWGCGAVGSASRSQ